jgi:hypothetical protein
MLGSIVAGTSPPAAPTYPYATWSSTSAPPTAYTPPSMAHSPPPEGAPPCDTAVGSFSILSQGTVLPIGTAADTPPPPSTPTVAPDENNHGYGNTASPTESVSTICTENPSQTGMEPAGGFVADGILGGAAGRR